jgi:hypothetical protein
LRRNLDTKQADYPYQIKLLMRIHTKRFDGGGKLIPDKNTLIYPNSAMPQAETSFLPHNTVKTRVRIPVKKRVHDIPPFFHKLPF